MPSGGFGLFTGALGRAIGETLGGMARGALTEEELRSQLGERRMLEQLHPYRVRAAEHREALYPYEREETRLGAEDLPRQLEHKRWRRGEEVRKADLAAPFEKETLEYETAVLRRKAALPKELRDAVAAEQARKGRPLKIAEQLEIGQRLAPDFETYKSYTLGLAGIAKAEQNADAARHQRAIREAMLRYWQRKQGMAPTTYRQSTKAANLITDEIRITSFTKDVAQIVADFQRSSPEFQDPTRGDVGGTPKQEAIAAELYRRRGVYGVIRWDPWQRKFTLGAVYDPEKVTRSVTTKGGAEGPPSESEPLEFEPEAE